jgi:hypothetical protein
MESSLIRCNIKDKNVKVHIEKTTFSKTFNLGDKKSPWVNKKYPVSSKLPIVTLSNEKLPFKNNTIREIKKPKPEKK